MTAARGSGTPLAALRLRPEHVDVLVAHFEDADRRGKRGHGLLRIEWLESPSRSIRTPNPVLLESREGFAHWHGNDALGYLVLDEKVAARSSPNPPERARVVVASRCFPSGVLGYWARDALRKAGPVAAVTATSPRRLAHPEGGPPLTGTNPLAIAVPSSDGPPVVSDVSMGAVTHGDVLAGRAEASELAPFGGGHSHKAFALAVGLELFVGALVGPEPGVVLVVARPEHDPVPGLRELAGARRLPGD